MSASGDQFKDLMETLGMVRQDAADEPEHYTVEPHGDGYAIYLGRNAARHGYNLGHLTECQGELPKLIESALNREDGPVAPTFDYPAIKDALDTALNRYLGTCSSGGMPKAQRDQIRAAVSQMVDLDYLALALAEALEKRNAEG